MFNSSCVCCFGLLLARLHIVSGVSIVLITGVCRCLSSSVTLHGLPAGGFTRAGQAMTSCRLQSNYSSAVTLHGGPVVLRPFRATPCFNYVTALFQTIVLVQPVLIPVRVLCLVTAGSLGSVKQCSPAWQLVVRLRCVNLAYLLSVWPVWLNGRAYARDPKGHMFKSRLLRFQVTALGKLLTRMCLCHQAV